MEEDDIFNDPIVKSAFAKKQQQAITAQIQQQAQYNKLAELQRSREEALSQIDVFANELPAAIKAGKGIQHELNVERNKIERNALLAKVAMNPSSKGANDLISIIKTQYSDESLKPFESTDTYKQAYVQFARLNDDYQVANVLNEQLGTLGNILIQGREAKDPKEAKTYKEQAKQYAITSIAQNLANATRPNAQQLNEFLRAAPDLLSPEQIFVLGGNVKQAFGALMDKFQKSAPNSEDRIDASSKLAQVFGTDPENWYKIAQFANKNLMARKAQDFREQIVSKVGPWHADEMGAKNPVVLDPLADYLAQKSTAPSPGFAQSDSTGKFTPFTGAPSTAPVQSGTMQAGTVQPGTVSGGTMAPTSRPRTRFTYITPQ
jgi:hypothetical protein